MTSKSPVRSCEDIDEAALSYAEVKALATGNPYIKEKMDLDIQVSKLKLMKANHTSQKYRLEDNITKHYPQQIAELRERIEGMESDIRTYEWNKRDADKDHFLMAVACKIYTDRKEAGTAILEACKEVKSSNEREHIGNFCGFRMSLAFDLFNNKYILGLKDKLSHNVELGNDVLGNITRIGNMFENMPKVLDELQQKLINVENQLESAKAEVNKPFEKEQELAEKIERLSELNALLNMDETGENEATIEEEKPKVADRHERISVKEKIVEMKERLIEKAPIPMEGKRMEEIRQEAIRQEAR